MVINNEFLVSRMPVAYSGWRAETDENEYGVDWESMSPKEINRLQVKLIEEGIKPLLACLLKEGLMDKRLENVKNKVLLLDRELFSSLTCYATNLPGCSVCVNLILENLLQDKPIDFTHLTTKGLKEEIPLEALQAYSGNFAQAEGCTQLLNKSIAEKRVGLHVICHEVMHCIANQGKAKKIRESVEEQNGDEAINEYFARLATLVFIANNPDLKKIAGVTVYNGISGIHNETNGIYGKLFQQAAYWNPLYGRDPETLKKLARDYFCGESNFIR